MRPHRILQLRLSRGLTCPLRSLGPPIFRTMAVNHVTVKQCKHLEFSSTVLRISVSSVEDLLAYAHSALCSHTWPSNRVMGYRQKHLRNVRKLISGTIGSLTRTSGHPECAVPLLFLTGLPLILPLTSFSVAPVQVNPELYILAKNPACSPTDHFLEKIVPISCLRGAFCFPVAQQSL